MTRGELIETFQALPQGLVILEIQKNKIDNTYKSIIVYTNRSFELLIYGQLNNEFHGKDICDIFPSLKEKCEKVIPLLLAKSSYCTKKEELYLQQNNKWIEVTMFGTQKNFYCLLFNEIVKGELQMKTLAKHNQFLYYYFENSNIASRIVDINYRIIRVNKEYSRFYGLPVNQIVGKYCYDFHNHENCKTNKCSITRLLRNESIASHELKHEAEGKTVNLSCEIIPLRNEKDELVGVLENLTRYGIIETKFLNNKDNLEVLVREKTRKLEISKNNFTNIFNSINDYIILTDFSGKILDLNKVAKTKIKYRNHKVFNIKTIFSNKKNEVRINEYFNNLNTVGKSTIEIYCENDHGVREYFEVKGKKIDYESRIAAMHIARDITERVNLQRKILRVVYETEERERNRFANDLHDSLGALLSAIKLQMSILGIKKLPNVDILRIIDRCKYFTEQAIISSREIANNIRPQILLNKGFVSAVNSFCNQVQIKNKFNINFVAENLKITLDKNIEIALYRIFHELLNNSMKHSNAKNINIHLFDIDKQLFLIYSDDGKGFDLNELERERNKGMGLKNIFNRLKSINGSYEIVTAPGNGFEIIIELNISGDIVDASF